MADKAVEKVNDFTIAVTEPKKRDHNLAQYKLEYQSIDGQITRLLDQYNKDLQDKKERKKFLEQAFRDGLTVGVDVGVNLP